MAGEAFKRPEIEIEGKDRRLETKAFERRRDRFGGDQRIRLVGAVGAAAMQDRDETFRAHPTARCATGAWGRARPWRWQAWLMISRISRS